MVEQRAPRKYSNGAVFVKYALDGKSRTAYYPSGRMATTYERMAGGFYAYFYADNRQATTLVTFDPAGCGFVTFEDGRPHLTSQKQGGSLVNEKGLIERLWTESKPLRGEPIEIEVTVNLTVRFKSRREILATLSCQGMHEEFVLGDPPERVESYLQKSVGTVKMGPERGKKILDIDKCRQEGILRPYMAAEESRALREASGTKDLGAGKKSNISQEYMEKHEELRNVVRATEELQSSVRAGEWNVEVSVPKGQLMSTLGDQLPTLRMGDSLRGDRYGHSLKGMAATDPDTLEVLLQSSVFDKNALPLSDAIRSASGRYRRDHGEHVRTTRRRLREIKAKEFDSFLTEEAPADTLVVVCCLAGWLPQCRKIEPMLELLNGELHDHVRPPPTAEPRIDKGSSSSSSPPFVLCKFNMSESRLLRDRYNINTMPMYLMYYNGRLAYASNTLNGYGSTREDLVGQARATLLKAKQGEFLPSDFKFSLTDNRLTESFSSTLGSTTRKLGANAAR